MVVRSHENNGDLDVVYCSISVDSEPKWWTRPLHQDTRDDSSWTDLVVWPDGVRRCRFMLEEP